MHGFRSSGEPYESIVAASEGDSAHEACRVLTDGGSATIARPSQHTHDAIANALIHQRTTKTDGLAIAPYAPMEVSRVPGMLQPLGPVTDMV